MGRYKKRCFHRNKIIYPQLVAITRAELWGWGSYECPIDGSHWHVTSRKENKPMTNYNERLDYLTSFMESIDWEFDENGYTFDDNYINFRTADMLRQNITSLIKELVAEAKPAHVHGTTVSSGQFNRGVSAFEQNLLKALSKEKVV